MARRRRSTHLRVKSKRPKSKAGKPIPWKAIRKHNRKRKKSSLEETVQKWLKDDGIPFKPEKAIGRCHVDVFIEPNVIVELNGCYWHGCESCNKQLNEAQRIARLKDGRRYYVFRKRGFDVIVLWEHEVLEQPDRCRAALKALYRPFTPKEE